MTPILCFLDLQPVDEMRAFLPFFFESVVVRSISAEYVPGAGCCRNSGDRDRQLLAVDLAVQDGLRVGESRTNRISFLPTHRRDLELERAGRGRERVDERVGVARAGDRVLADVSGRRSARRRTPCTASRPLVASFSVLGKRDLDRLAVVLLGRVVLDRELELLRLRLRLRAGLGRRDAAVASTTERASGRRRCRPCRGRAPPYRRRGRTCARRDSSGGLILDWWARAIPHRAADY